MTKDIPWQVRCFRTLEFIGICGLACGSIIGRPAYFLAGGLLAFVGAICQTVWHFTRSRS